MASKIQNSAPFRERSFGDVQIFRWATVVIHSDRCPQCSMRLNPFTPKSDQVQNSPADRPEILHHTVWRTWLFIPVFIAHSDERWLHYQFLTNSLIQLSLKGWDNVLFELRSERVRSSIGRFRFGKSSALVGRERHCWIGHCLLSNVTPYS